MVFEHSWNISETFAKNRFFDHPPGGCPHFVLKSLRDFNTRYWICSKIVNFEDIDLPFFLVKDEVKNCPGRDFGGRGMISHGHKSILL